jgi:hypothetical protein
VRTRESWIPARLAAAEVAVRQLGVGHVREVPVEAVARLAVLRIVFLLRNVLLGAAILFVCVQVERVEYEE